MAPPKSHSTFFLFVHLLAAAAALHKAANDTRVNVYIIYIYIYYMCMYVCMYVCVRQINQSYPMHIICPDVDVRHGHRERCDCCCPGRGKEVLPKLKKKVHKRVACP